MAEGTAVSTDPSLWTIRRAFGVAGGPDEVVLTEEGLSRAFSVGAQVKSGAPAKALELLYSLGEGQFSARRDGASRIYPTELGRFDQITWGYLRAKGYVVSMAPDGVRITDSGSAAVARGIEERLSLLDRCRRAARTR